MSNHKHKNQPTPKNLTQKDLLWMVYGELQSLDRAVTWLQRIVILALASELGLTGIERIPASTLNTLLTTPIHLIRLLFAL